MIIEQPNTECPYCLKPIFWDGKWTECKMCNVSFIQDGGRGLHIKWERDIGHLSVALNLFPDINRTILSVYDDQYPVDDTSQLGGKLTELKLDHCMDGVTNENCIDKIKLLLVWQ